MSLSASFDLAEEERRARQLEAAKKKVRLSVSGTNRADWIAEVIPSHSDFRSCHFIPYSERVGFVFQVFTPFSLAPPPIDSAAVDDRNRREYRPEPR